MLSFDRKVFNTDKIQFVCFSLLSTLFSLRAQRFVCPLISRNIVSLVYYTSIHFALVECDMKGKFNSPSGTYLPVPE